MLTKRAKKHKRVVLMKRKRSQHKMKAKVIRAIELSEQEDVATADTDIYDECSQQAEEPSTNTEETSLMCEMENDESSLVSQSDEQGVDHNVLLEAAYQEIEELRASLRKQDARCSELERASTESRKKECDLAAKINDMSVKNINLETENADLKEKIKELQQNDCSECQHASLVKDLQKKMATLELKCISMTMLKNNESFVKFYTGLPDHDTLKAVFDLCCECLPSTTEHGHRKLTNEDEFLLTIMKLRLNLRNADLAFRFGIAESTVSKIIHKWLNILYVSLKFLIHWPTRDEVRATLPECFRSKFGKAVVIIDCTEVFIERATNLLARSQTWSNYKSHNTIKYLLGITPQGTISFVSKAWGGRVSDKQITQECGLLQLLLPGDLVLADRGFNIYELIGMQQAEAKLPSFTRGKSQLSAKEVQDSRELAVVRIHIERLIGVIKQKYTILEGILPISFIKADAVDVSVADKLMVICCALVNLCEPIVPIN